MTIRAILFDLDNTLYPASSGVMQSIDRRIGEYVQQRLGLPEDEASRLRHHFYTTYGTTLRGLQQYYADVETEEYLRFVHDIEVDRLLRFDAELDLALARLPLPKVIFTNSPREHAERVLGAMRLAHHFERIFDLRYFNFVAKPDPACYQHVLDEMGLAGHEAVLLEDTPHNLAPAKALGMTTILIVDAPCPCDAADYQVQNVMAALSIAQSLAEPRLSLLPQAVPAPKQRVRLRRSA
ncbi:MAG TPA: pyrimidine 5'-nucleotidase [Herpetosiphonaceae bacterium]